MNSIAICDYEERNSSTSIVCGLTQILLKAEKARYVFARRLISF